MDIYGDGSDGSLSVLSGTQSLSLDRKYQYTDVTVASGATITTGSTTGSVLYILCSGTFTLDGTIDLRDKVTRGSNGWSVTIDGVTYTTPGVASGGNGSGDGYGSVGGTSASGYGGGGGGSGRISIVGSGSSGFVGGAGGSGGTSQVGGSGNYISRTTNGTTDSTGNAGSGSGGGGGAAQIYLNRDQLSSVAAIGGSGASSYGGTGNTGGGSANSHGSGTTGWVACGGGGGGGNAGRAGVHVVIKARTLVLNGTIYTGGSVGLSGGRGGQTIYQSGTTSYYGGGGGGGGGGNGGDLKLTYSDSLTDSSSKVLSGAAGGSGGAGGYSLGSTAPSGSTGTAGTTSFERIYITGSGATATGDATLTYELATYAAHSVVYATGRGTFTTIYQALPQKEYEYRVFDASDNYIGTWRDVESGFSYSQGINETPTELTVDIARSPDNRVVIYENLLDENGATVLDSNSDPIMLSTESANAVGPGSDVDLNYNVDVYAFYGGYESLLDENQNEILDENGSAILTQYGAPNGARVYSGYIADYELRYGDKTGVRVIIAPHSTDMSHYVFKSGTSTTVEYNSVDPVTMARDSMDNYLSQGGRISYQSATMPLSGTTASYDFKLQTIKETVDKTIELLPSGYYYYPNPANNTLYLLQKAATADHTFVYEKHITDLNLRKSITQLVNEVYFVGGETASVKLFKHYEDATSIASYRPGLKRLADSRVTLDASAEALSQREIDTYSVPRYRTTVTISDAVYDIESIRLGEMVSFRNFGTFVDDLLLQIVKLNAEEHTVMLDLDMIVPNDTKRLLELKKNLMSEEVRNLSSAPV